MSFAAMKKKVPWGATPHPEKQSRKRVSPYKGLIQEKRNGLAADIAPFLTRSPQLYPKSVLPGGLF